MILPSIHDKLERVRRPRVHIKYEVETEGAQAEKELPFVVGVLGDFSGHPTEEVRPLRERKFVQIDRDNFDDVLARMAPSLRLRVSNTLKGDGSEMPVDLAFKSMDDFEPGAVVEQVPALRRLLAKRNELRDLLSKADRSEALEALLDRVLQDDVELKRLADELSSKTEAGKRPAGEGDGA